ncbi:MAG TPA: acyl carrier protein [Actinoplanes sp.]|jgi:hypothetical protein
MSGDHEPLLDIARDVLARPGLTVDDDLLQCGGTSLSIVRIIAVASRELGADIDPRNVEGAVTVRHLARAARHSATSTQPLRPS